MALRYDEKLLSKLTNVKVVRCWTDVKQSVFITTDSETGENIKLSWKEYKALADSYVKDVLHNTVRCSWCLNFVDKQCLAQNVNNNLKANKKRKCNYFVLDPVNYEKRVLRHKNVKTQWRPDTIYMSNSEIKKRQKLQKEALEKARRGVNTEHPITGDLSKFKTTGDE